MHDTPLGFWIIDLFWEKCKCNVIPFLKMGLKRDVNFYMSFPHLPGNG